MIWTLPDGSVARNSAEMKNICRERGMDWRRFRNQARKGLARRPGGPRAVRLPDEWRLRLDAIFGPRALFEFVKGVPHCRPAIVAVVSATDTRWWHRIAEASALICLVRGRINHVDVDTGERLTGNPKGTLVHLLADTPEAERAFAAAMNPFGRIVRPNFRRAA